MPRRSPLAQRLRAAELFAQGYSQASVARRTGVTRTTAMRWHRVWHRGGPMGLARAGRPGRPPKLAGGELSRTLASLPRTLSIEQVAAEIQRRTGVKYHPGHVWRILRAWGWAELAAPRTCLTLRDPEGHGIYLCRRRSGASDRGS